MKLLFIADPLQSFKIYKDTTFAMMREAQRRGHTLAVCEPQHITWQRGSKVTARVCDIQLTADPVQWYAAQPGRSAPLASFDAVLMRKDPPFDSEYFYATHLLEQAERDGARVFNKPRALRDHPEKLAIMEFPEFIGPTLVTRDAADIQRFHAEHGDIILKPLDGMGGMGIFRNPEPPRRAKCHGSEVLAGDRRRRQTCPHHRGGTSAFLPGAHPAGQRSPGQPGCRRQGGG
jgi:glutathione synthase